MSSSQQKVTMWKETGKWPILRKEKKSIETNSEQAQILDLADKDFKATFKNVFKELKKLCLNN